MSVFVYLMADSEYKNVHAGMTKDLFKMVAFYRSIPNLSIIKKLNMLIYVEEYPTDELAVLRFKEMNQAARSENLALAKTVNPDLIELIPGVNFELN